jgi:hypothetical protein
MIEQIQLNKDTKIYKMKYDFVYNKKVLLDRAYQSIKLNKTHPTDRNNFFYVGFKCLEFEHLNNLIIKGCEEISDIKSKEWAIQNWIYKMNNSTNNEIYHTHIDLIEGDNRIQTDWTFCLYVQIPKNISGDDGKISFKTNDGIEHMFLPEEGDIFIFPADLLHTPKLIKNCEVDRIVYAGNISLTPLKKINDISII